MSFNNVTKQRLGDIIDIKHGFAFKGEFFSLTETDDLILSPGNFKIGGGFKADKFKYYNGKYPKEYILKENDIIVTMTDLSKEGDTLGYSAKIPFSENKRYLHNQRLGLVEFKNDDFDEDYIYWLLRTKDYQTFIVNSATGTTVRHTSPTRIKEYEFLAPNKTTQTTIANILSSIDDKIELNRQTNITLETIAQTLFKEMCLTKSEELPDGWRIGKLSEVCFVQNGYAFKSKDFTDEGEIGIIKIRNISNNLVDVINTQFVSVSIIKSLDKKFKIKTGSLVIAMTGAEVGKIGITPFSEKELWLNQRVGMFVEKVKFANHFLFILLSSSEFQSILQNNSQGSAQPNISSTAIENINMTLPPIHIIEKFGEIVNPFFETILQNEKETQTLIILRDSLLPKLMKGEISLDSSNK